jgi:hypothetical protein
MHPGINEVRRVKRMNSGVESGRVLKSGHDEYQGQKVNLFRPSLSFCPRRSRGLKQVRTKGTFWQRFTLNSLHELRSKRHNLKHYKFILHLPFSNR